MCQMTRLRRGRIVVTKFQGFVRNSLAVEGVLADFDRRAHRDAAVAQAERKLRPTFEGLLDELKGDGGSPDLLLNIYQTS